MSMCFIHGLSGASSGVEPPDKYKPYVAEAKTLYTGEYEGYFIAENAEYLNVAFMMPSFHIVNYVLSSTEFQAYGWYACRYHKSAETWDTFDFRESTSTGWNYFKNIRYIISNKSFDGNVSSVLNDNSWETISAHSVDGDNYWSVGDRKSVTLNGTVGTQSINGTYYVFILGFNHNSSVEGSGIHFGGFKTALSGGTDICLVDSKYSRNYTDGGKYFNMNHSSNTNTGGWKGCDLRYDILGSVNSEGAQNAATTTATSPVSNTLMAALPSDLRAVMQPMTKYSDNTGGGSDAAGYVAATTDYLPLLAEWEIFGARTYANSAEKNYQEQYDYYANGNSKVKYKHGNVSVTSIWWERSVDSTRSSAFCIVNESGSATGTGAGNSFGISPAFKI